MGSELSAPRVYLVALMRCSLVEVSMGPMKREMGTSTLGLHCLREGAGK